MRPVTCRDTGETCYTYEAYLRSKHWQRLRVAWQRSGRPYRCAMCDSPRFDLHHITYERIGHESLDDLVPLCPEHQAAIHKVSVRISGNVAAELTRKRRRSNRRRPKKQRPPRPTVAAVGVGNEPATPRLAARDAAYRSAQVIALENERHCHVDA